MWKFLKEIFNAPPYSPLERIRSTTHIVPPMPPCKPPRIDRSEVLSMGEGDTLVITCERMLTAEQIEKIKICAEGDLPNGCKVMVLCGGLQVGTVIARKPGIPMASPGTR